MSDVIQIMASHWCAEQLILFFLFRYRAAPYTGNVLTLPVDKCTHVIYTFLGLDESTNRVKYLDPFLDIDHSKNVPGVRVI